MRNFIYAIGVCSLLFSCNSELETLPEEFNTEGPAPLVTRVAAHPKYGVLGWGYDVTGNYMSHGKGVTLPVIDIDRFEAENFDRIVLDSSTSQETEYYYGTTAEEYLKRVGDNVDTGVDAKKALFSLTITGNYQKNTSYSSEYSFAGCDHYYSLKRCYIKAAVERLQNYLSDTFREDLAELPAEDIVDFYGTHVLADIRMGGRVSFLYKTYAGKENVEAIQASAQEAANEWAIWQRTHIGTDINTDVLIEYLRAAGVKRVVIRSPGYTAISDTQIAVAQNITASYGGLEND